MNEINKFSFKPVDKSNWSDFEKLFESRGGPHSCWCMVWRAEGEELKHRDKINRKVYIKKRIDNKGPIGLLAYCNNESVGWCSIAPRETYRRLNGDDSSPNVWSIACFFIKRDFRGHGLTKKFIDEAIVYAGKNGAKFIEAYPVEPDSPSYRFMGYKHIFEEAGFRFIKKTGTRRNVMLKQI